MSRECEEERERERERVKGICNVWKDQETIAREEQRDLSPLIYRREGGQCYSCSSSLTAQLPNHTWPQRLT